MLTKQIKKQLQAILDKLNGDEEMTEEEIQELEEKANELEEEKKSLISRAEKRKATLERIRKGFAGEVVEEPEERKDEEKMENENVHSTAEYRSAYLKRLLGRELDEKEKRAYELSNADGVLPVETSENVIKKLTQIAPMLEEITLLHVPGSVKFAVEGVKTDGAIHKENASITADGDTLVTVVLAGYEVTKLIQVSKSVEKMSLNAFETWLVDMIAEMVGTKIEDLIFNGSGTAQAKGINTITWTKGKNAIEIASGANITADSVRQLVALLPGGYDNGAKFYLRKSTLFNRIMGLQDNAKHDLVKEANGKYYIYGYEVKLSDKAPADEVILGNAKKYVANLAEGITVVNQFDIDTNSNKYLGSAVFDGKPAIEEAFVKIVQLTA